MKKFSVLGVLLLLVATMSLTMAQAAKTVNVKMDAVEGSKVSGTATVTESGGGIKVSVKLTGYNPNQESAGHIHSGVCGSNGPVVFPLTAIKADASGNGSIESTVANAPYATVTGQPHYVQYHTANNPPGRQVSCGNIVAAPASTGGQGGAAGGGSTPSGAPASGIGGGEQSGFPTFLLLGGLALLLTGSGAAYRVARQRAK